MLWGLKDNTKSHTQLFSELMPRLTTIIKKWCLHIIGLVQVNKGAPFPAGVL